jgi:hypothetical protein
MCNVYDVEQMCKIPYLTNRTEIKGTAYKKESRLKRTEIYIGIYGTAKKCKVKRKK